MQQLAGINELRILPTKIVTAEDIIDSTNLKNIIIKEFELPPDVCFKYNATSLELITANISDYMETYLRDFLGKRIGEVFDDFIEYCRHE